MKNQCAICGGDMKNGTTTFTVDYNDGLIVIRNVTAMVCHQCGETWIDDATAKQLERFVTEARNNQKQLEVLDYPTRIAA